MRLAILVKSVVLVLLLSVAACGGSGNSTPAAPSTPVVTTQSIAVTLPSPMVVGSSVQATAVATLSNGSTQAITSGFKSDVPSVATVTDSGMVTAVSAGAANIYVVSGGQQGTRNITVIPNYAGNWSGSYTVTSCLQTGDFATASVCDDFPTSRVLPYNMVLTQTVSTVTGTFFLGTVEFSQSSATIDGGGNVALSGSYNSGTTSFSCIWNVSSPTAGRLSGTVQLTWTDSTAIGRMIVTGTIRDSMKTFGAMRSTDAQIDNILRKWQQRVRR